MVPKIRRKKTFQHFDCVEFEIWIFEYRLDQHEKLGKFQLESKFYQFYFDFDSYIPSSQIWTFDKYVADGSFMNKLFSAIFRKK